MTHILTVQEAANVCRCEVDDPQMLDLLPSVDAYIFRATGRRWEEDALICEQAKMAARMLLVQWHENPGMSSSEQAVISGGLAACLAQLEAMAQYYFTFEGVDGTGYIILKHVHEGDTVISVTGRVGLSGDQAAKFESVITVDHYIQQTSSEDLEDKWFTAYIVPPEEI